MTMSTSDGIRTKRLHLRLFRMEDASVVKKFAGDPDVARTTANIPHPYEDGMAEAWIRSQYSAIARGDAMTFAVTLKKDAALIGSMSLSINKVDRLGELGYWIGKPYWSNGYCTEAAQAMIAYGFMHLGLNRIQARHMASNPASGRVMQKCHMDFEGTHRQVIYRNGTFEDLSIYAILRESYDPSLFTALKNERGNAEGE